MLVWAVEADGRGGSKGACQRPHWPGNLGPTPSLAVGTSDSSQHPGGVGGGCGSGCPALECSPGADRTALG